MFYEKRFKNERKTYFFNHNENATVATKQKRFKNGMCYLGMSTQSLYRMSKKSVEIFKIHKNRKNSQK